MNRKEAWITPEQALEVACRYLQEHNLPKKEMAVDKGASSYLVFNGFRSFMTLEISPTGEVLSVGFAPM